MGTQKIKDPPAKRAKKGPKSENPGGVPGIRNVVRKNARLAPFLEENLMSEQPRLEEVSDGDVFLRVQDMENPVNVNDNNIPSFNPTTQGAETLRMFAALQDAKTLGDLQNLAGVSPQDLGKALLSVEAAGQPWVKRQVTKITNTPYVSGPVVTLGVVGTAGGLVTVGGLVWKLISYIRS